MASTKATELAQLSRKLTYNEGTDVAAIDGDGSILTTGDNTDQLQEGSTNLYYLDSRARAALSGGTGVTYNSTTGEITIGQSVGTTDSVTFDTVTLSTLNFGSDTSIAWNSAEGTLDVTLNDATLQLGQEQYFYAKATEDIANGDVVMFVGSQGDHALIAKADQNSVGFFPEAVMGVATEEILNNEFGYVTTFGKVRGIDLSALQNGDLLYLSDSTAGALTTTAPAFPSHAILVAAVLDNKNNGTMLVRLTHINDLDELHNVSITSAASGDVLVWNGTNWVNNSGYYTSSETDTAISTAISNLVDSAPGTLDTLNELAAALGDDPNFATTVTTSLSDKVSKSTDTTDVLNEGSTNLYYTDGRVQAVVTQTYINNLNVDADTVDGKHYDDIINDATALAIALG